MVRSELIVEAEGLDPLTAGWDALAVAAARPYCAPAWLLAWWRHAAPPRALLRVAVVTDDAGLIGIAPFFLGRGAGGPTLRPLGAGTCLGVEPLARAGREKEVAARLVAELAGTRPAPAAIALEGIGSGSPWPALLAHAWPGRGEAWTHVRETVASPFLELTGKSADAWNPTPGSAYRGLLRKRRRLREEGAAVRIAAGDELPAAVHAFVQLHEARWAAGGGSGVVHAGVESMLVDAARAMSGEGRLRLFVLDLDGETIAAAVLLAAGGEVTYWLGGFDERWRTRSPSMLLLLEALEDAIQRGDRRFDLGAGPQSYKYEFADRDGELCWLTIIPAGPGQLVTRARLLPGHARRWAARTIPEQHKRRLKRMLPRTLLR